jgi:hypothetical protein
MIFRITALQQYYNYNDTLHICKKLSTLKYFYVTYLGTTELRIHSQKHDNTITELRS